MIGREDGGGFGGCDGAESGRGLYPRISETTGVRRGSGLPTVGISLRVGEDAT